jgi:hypothetical protein
MSSDTDLPLYDDEDTMKRNLGYLKDGRNAKFKTTISELGAMTVTINPTHLKWWGLTDRED